MVCNVHVHVIVIALELILIIELSEGDSDFCEYSWGSYVFEEIFDHADETIVNITACVYDDSQETEEGGTITIHVCFGGVFCMDKCIWWYVRWMLLVCAKMLVFRSRLSGPHKTIITAIQGKWITLRVRWWNMDHPILTVFWSTMNFWIVLIAIY